jgi:hypothetical protein
MDYTKRHSTIKRRVEYQEYIDIEPGNSDLVADVTQLLKNAGCPYEVIEDRVVVIDTVNNFMEVDKIEALLKQHTPVVTENKYSKLREPFYVCPEGRSIVNKV